MIVRLAPLDILQILPHHDPHSGTSINSTNLRATKYTIALEILPRTMRICFDELRRAQEISPRPNFLILLGNRYGWRPLPEEISVAEFQALERAVAQVATITGKPASAILRPESG